jgi:hypothetical protein
MNVVAFFFLRAWLCWKRSYIYVYNQTLQVCISLALPHPTKSIIMLNATTDVAIRKEAAGMNGTHVQ